MGGITTFLDPALMPFRTQEQKPFDDAMAYVMQTLPKWSSEVNAALGLFNAALGGGAYALPYVFDTATADADPTLGKLRLSSATQNTATVLRLDVLAGGVDMSSIIDTFDASTSTVKGSIRLVKMSDQSKFLAFNVTARAAPSGYRNLSITNIGGSSANPFANGDPLLLFFTRSGDKGDRGDTGSAMFLLGSAIVTTPVANIDFLSAFNADCDKYFIEAHEVSYSGLNGGSGNMAIRLAKAGVVDASGAYTMPASYAQNNDTAFNIGMGAPGANYAECSLQIDNVNSAANRPKTILATQTYWSGGPPPQLQMYSSVCQYLGTANPSGFRFYATQGLIATGTFRVWGLRTH